MRDGVFPEPDGAGGRAGNPGPVLAGLPGFVWRGVLCGAALTALALCGRLEAGRFVYAACFAAAFAALVWAVRGWPGHCLRRRTTLAILALGLGFRLLFLWAWPADTDVFRYIVEGDMQLAGANPYLTPPNDPGLPGLLSEAAGSVLARVNQPGLSAAYPPLAELAFRAVAALSPTPLAFRAVFALVDLLSVLVLAGVLARRGLPPAWLALYALCPLSLVMGAGEGHLDALTALGVALAWAAFAARRDGLGFLCLGAAGLVKYPALLLMAFFLRPGNLSRAWWGLVPLAAFWPYREAGGALFASLAAFAGHVAHGGPLTALLWPLCAGAAPAVSLALGGAALAVAWLVVQDRERGPVLACVIGLGALPTVYPWYFLMALPLWTVRPGRSLLWLLAAQGLCVSPVWLRGASLGGEGVLLAMAWIPALVLAFFPGGFPGLAVPGRRFAPAGRLSVVVPARNEAGGIVRCLASLARAGVYEVIVADGGSTDGTVALARNLGATLVAAGGGRGGQIAAGLAACRGEAVLVLHADAVAAPDVPARIVRALARCPEAAGGVVGMGYDRTSPGLFLLAGLNALRARTVGIGFGDQGQFFRREALDGAGGYPAMALMEDVEVSLRLRQAGETLYLGGGVRVSGRRWAGPGFGGKAAGVVGLCLVYLLGRRLGFADPTGRRYYLRYYGRAPHHTAV
jgi:hypothetical protein